MIDKLFKNQWQLILITLGGLGIRLYKLTAISLWHDEAFSALLIKYSWKEMIYRIGLDVHPPMYYIFLRFWHDLFGYSLASLRGMSVFFGVATIIAGYVLVKEIFDDKKFALLAALFIAFNPFQAQYVTEARMYTMGAFFAIIGTAFLIRALKLQKKYYLEIPNPAYKRRVILYYLLFALSSIIMALTHYYLLFTIAALGAFGIFYHIKYYGWQLKRYSWLIASGVLIALGFLPWLKVFLFQFKQVGAGYWIPPLDRWSIPRTLYDLLFRIAEPSHWLLILVAAISLVIIWVFIKKYREDEKWLILGTFLAPYAGSILFLLLAKLRGQNSSIFLVRYFLFASSYFLIMTAGAISLIKKDLAKRVVILLFIFSNVFSIFHYWKELDTDKRSGMAAAAKYLAANVEPNQKLYIGSSFIFFNYKYYNQTPVAPLLYSGGSLVDNLPHFAGTAILTNDDLLLDFAKGAKIGDTVWLLWTTGFGSEKPVVPNNWIQRNEAGFEDVRPYPGSWIVATQYTVE